MNYFSSLANTVVILLSLTALGFTVQEGINPEIELNTTVVWVELFFIAFYVSNIFMNWMTPRKTIFIPLILINLLLIPFIIFVYVIAMNLASQVLASVDPTAELESVVLYGSILGTMCVINLFNSGNLSWLLYAQKNKA